MKYPRGTVLKWTRNAMARAHALSPHDRMILLKQGSDAARTVLYRDGEVIDVSHFVVDVRDVMLADEPTPRGLRIDVREMSDDPGIPALIEEFGMERI